MCTVTYIPKEEGTFILTHSRDESIKRKIASPPIKRIINGMKHIFPIDPAGMGTWIGISENGRAAGLLNGGKKDHTHNPPYKHSRGLVIPEYFKFSGFMDFYENYAFDGLEPFTLLAFEDGTIYEAVLDEDGINYRTLPAEKPFIYSSTTLYTEKSRSARKMNFMEWYLLTRDVNQAEVLKMHNKFRFEDELDKSKVPGGHILRTVSITSVTHAANAMQMNYLDLVNDIGFRNELVINDVSREESLTLQ